MPAAASAGRRLYVHTSASVPYLAARSMLQHLPPDARQGFTPSASSRYREQLDALSLCYSSSPLFIFCTTLVSVNKQCLR